MQWLLTMPPISTNRTTTSRIVECKMTMAYGDENPWPALERHINATLLNGLIKYCLYVVHCYIQPRRYEEAAPIKYLITGWHVNSNLIYYLNNLSGTGVQPRFSVGVRGTQILVLCVCFVDRCLSFCTFSFDHCVVCSSSIYGFWLPLWYLQTLFYLTY